MLSLGDKNRLLQESINTGVLNPNVTDKQLIHEAVVLTRKGNMGSYNMVLKFLVERSYDGKYIIKSDRFEDDDTQISYLGLYMNQVLLKQDQDMIDKLKSVITKEKDNFINVDDTTSFMIYLNRDIDKIDKSLLIDIYSFLINLYGDNKTIILDTVITDPILRHQYWLIKEVMLSYTNEDILEQLFFAIEFDEIYYNSALDYLNFTTITFNEIKNYSSKIGKDDDLRFTTWLNKVILNQI